MTEAIVRNVFWSQGSAGGKIYVLYSDYTYDIVRTKHNPRDWNTKYENFKTFINLRVLREKRYTKEKALQYIETKDKEFKDWRGI